MAKKSSSSRWMAEHLNDYYVKKAKEEGYRSRAVYKLLEIIEKKNFINSGDYVLDLGSAPGGWSQLAIKYVGNKGKVVASDILPMALIDGVEFIQGDFTRQEVYDEIMATTGGQECNKFDVVLSDMAPSMSGHLSVDLPKAMYLSELALEIAQKSLQKDGYFCIKLFQGEGFDGFLNQCRQTFVKVNIIKPKASRPRSKEVYLFAHKIK